MAQSAFSPKRPSCWPHEVSISAQACLPAYRVHLLRAVAPLRRGTRPGVVVAAPADDPV